MTDGLDPADVDPRVLQSPGAVLSLHGIGDLLVPLSRATAPRGGGPRRVELLVQRPNPRSRSLRVQHGETAQGWHDLVNWVRSVFKPGAVNVLDPQEVASSFGCRYTDPAAYGDPADYRTRRSTPLP